MCELYPRLNSCCGIPVRIALIFIAILSIVTGALMNAALKKAGVNIASIQDVRNIQNLTKGMFGPKSPAPGYPGVPGGGDNPWGAGGPGGPGGSGVPGGPGGSGGPGGPGGSGGPMGPGEPGGPGGPGGPNIRAEDTEDARSATKSFESDDVDEDAKLPTIEIIGEDVDAFTEAIRFNEETDDSHEGHGTKGNSTNTSTSTTTTTMATTTTTQTWDQREMSQDPAVRAMGMLNRNGLNFVAILFIALGILLFVANFMNSPDLMMLYVVLCIVNCAVGLLLLFSVVAECAKARQVCLLNRLDWFSSMGVLIIWFFYVFAWAFFAAVANGFANESTGNELPL